MTEELFFIVNPAANNGKALQTWQRVKEHLDKKNRSYRFAISKDAADVIRLARENARRDVLLVSVGGDGTLSLVAQVAEESGATLGIIPAGTGNDFARHLHIPFEPEAACDVLLDGTAESFDLGIYNGRAFFNVLGCGLDAEVANDANLRFKRFSGTAVYVLAMLRQLAVFRPRRVRLVLDGQELVEKVWLVAVANASYFGGGMKVAPDANPCDGLADVIVVTDVSIARFLRLFPRVYKGTHVFDKAVRVYRAKEVSLFSDNKMSIQADGEILGYAPFTVYIKEKCVRVKVPSPGAKRSLPPAGQSTGRGQ